MYSPNKALEMLAGQIMAAVWKEQQKESAKARVVVGAATETCVNEALMEAFAVLLPKE